ncbi:MAG: DUF1737 domain-containing protein [Clostridia bacterium]|nr:DUF1737 domain-containing protein [Clostridia bacterium]
MVEYKLIECAYRAYDATGSGYLDLKEWFEQEVNEALKDGWIPQGGVQICHDTIVRFSQAVTRQV